VTVPINTDPFPFRWEVERSGYEWVRGLDSEWRLAPRVSTTQQTTVYEPLKDNRLFFRFAGLKPTRRDIQQFAIKYGTLFRKYGLEDMVRRAPGPYDSSELYGTSLRRWTWEIEAMSSLARVWRAIKGSRGNALKNVVFWKDNNSVGYKIGGRRSWLATPHLRSFLLPRFKPNDVFRPAMYVLQSEINRRIAEYDSAGYAAIVPRLVWCPGPRIEGIARPDHHQRIVFQPTNLLAAMWLQFARTVTEEHQVRICEGCGEYFQIGKGARRMHAQTCGDRCRQRLSRRLKSKG